MKHSSPTNRLVEHKNNTVNQKAAFKKFLVKLSPRGTSYNTIDKGVMVEPKDGKGPDYRLA